MAAKDFSHIGSAIQLLPHLTSTGREKEEPKPTIEELKVEKVKILTIKLVVTSAPNPPQQVKGVQLDVKIAEGENLFQAMLRAEGLHYDEFRFTTLPSQWGPYIDSINGVYGDSSKKWYWIIYVEGKWADKGVSGLYPKFDGEIYTFRYEYVNSTEL